MGTWNAFYVRANLDAQVQNAIVAAFPAAVVEVSSKFVGVRRADTEFEVPASLLTGLSRKLKTDVFWLSFQSTVDAFQFHHWSGGRPIRSLVYGCFEEERTWERVEGEAETWEREIFFAQKDLEFTLRLADGAAAKEELRRIWATCELEPGRTEPSLDACLCAQRIAAHYGFPHYGEPAQ